MNTTRIITIAAAFAATVATFGIGSAALAKEDNAAPQLALDISNVDFSNPASVETLHSRIRHAARQVCDNTARTALVRTMQEQECYREALASADQRLAAMRSGNGNQVAIAQAAPKTN